MDVIYLFWELYKVKSTIVDITVFSDISTVRKSGEIIALSKFHEVSLTMCEKHTQPFMCS
ncbi:hypothetical protein KVMX100_121325 [Klebsiella variicola]|nr:hypothetical protein KVMX100_121325 [Klebsiella variicola]